MTTAYKYRTSDNVGHLHEYYGNPAGAPPPSAQPIGPWQIPIAGFNPLTEICTDQGGTHRNDWHSFHHYRRKASVKGGVSLRVKSGSTLWGPENKEWWFASELPSSAVWHSSAFGPAWDPSVDLPAMVVFDPGKNIFYVPPPDQLDTLLEDAAKALLPGIKANLSTINSLVELRDLKSLVTTARRLHALLEVLEALKPHHSPRLRKLAAKQVLRQSGDGYLQYKFNLAPLYSDIKGLLKTFKNYQAAAMQLVSQSERSVTRHFSLVLQYPDSDLSQTLVAPAIPVTGYFNVVPTLKRTVSLRPVKFHVEWSYSFKFTAFQKQHAALFAVMDGLGVNLNPAIIWNAIPWSFTVDWLLGVSKFLDQFKLRNLEPAVYIQRSLWSVSRTRVITTSVSALGQEGVPVSECVETAYGRNLYDVTGSSSVRTSGLSLVEASLAAALGVTRRPRTR